MKWWQLSWILEENIGFLRDLTDAPEWAKYRQWLDEDEMIVKTQRRDILDSIVPDELCLKALQGSVWHYVLEDGFF